MQSLPKLRSQPTNWDVLQELARAEALLGHKTEALEAVHRLLATLPAGGDTLEEPSKRLELVFALLWTGDKDSALKELVEIHQRSMMMNVHYVRIAAEFAPFRGDPQFEAFLADPKNNAPRF